MESILRTINEILYILFSAKSLKLYSFNIPHFGPATFQALSSHMGLAAAVLGSAVTGNCHLSWEGSL